MIATELRHLQSVLGLEGKEYLGIGTWCRLLVVKLLEITHGMWIYRNIMVHDQTGGVLATSRKEKLQEAIEEQLELGGEGLREEDQWLLEVNLGDLERGTGNRESWLPGRDRALWEDGEEDNHHKAGRREKGTTAAPAPVNLEVQLQISH